MMILNYLCMHFDEDAYGTSKAQNIGINGFAPSSKNN